MTSNKSCGACNENINDRSKEGVWAAKSRIAMLLRWVVLTLSPALSPYLLMDQAAS